MPRNAGAVMHQRGLAARRLARCAAVVALLLPMAPATVDAQAGGADSVFAGWTWSVTPYAWGAGIKGRVGVGGNVGDVDLSFGDILESLDLALMGVVEARYDRWIFRIDGFVVSTTDDGPVTLEDGSPATARINQDQTQLAPEIGYAVFVWPTGAVDALLGARYWTVDARLDVQANTGAVQERDGNVDWVDGFVGARVRATPWDRNWHLFARGDVGGGGSDLTWQATGGVTYDITRCCSIVALYRHLDVKYVTDDFTNDVAMSGPAIGVEIRF